MTNSTGHSRCRCGADLVPFKGLTGRDIVPDVCPACREAEERRIEAEERRKRMGKLWQESLLPPAARDWDLTKASTDARAGFEQARYWQYSPEGLYLWGPAGTGKTVTVWGLLRRQIEAERAVLFVAVPQFLGALRQGVAEGRSTERRAAGVPVLCLDDLGAEKPSEWVRETLLAIIDARINAKLPTIFTSNCSPGKLDAHLGDPAGRIPDRIVGTCRIVGFSGESFRREAGRERMRQAEMWA